MELQCGDALRFLMSCAAEAAARSLKLRDVERGPARIEEASENYYRIP